MQKKTNKQKDKFNSQKSYIRTTILQEAMEYLEDEAFKEYM